MHNQTNRNNKNKKRNDHNKKQQQHTPQRNTGPSNMLKQLATLLLVCGAAPALAVDLDSFKVGAFEVVPDFNTKVTPSGRTYLANGEEQTSELLTFKPRITARASLDGREISSTFEVQNGNYSAGQLDNFIDWRFENTLGMEVGSQGRLRLRTELFDSHEAGDNAFSDTTAQHFSASGINASYEHSLWANRGKLVMDAGRSGKQYLDSAMSNSFRDHEITQAGGEFRLRVLPGADMLLQYHSRDVKYLATPGLASPPGWRSEILSFVGGSWEGEAGITGDWRIASGYRQTSVQSFDAQPGNATWETRVRWQPLAAGVVTFDADRRYGTGFDDSPDIDSYRYNVEYRWAPMLKTTLAGTWSSKSWDSSAREEERMGLKMRMDYAWSSWVDMFVSVGHEQRWSPQSGFNFSQQSLMLGVAASLDRLFDR